MAEKDLRENPFRDEIFEYFLANGYVESKKKDYDFKNAIDREKLFEFLESSQPDELEKFRTTYGPSYRDRFVDLLNKKINDRGLIASFNEWVEDYASNTKFNIAYFKSSLESMTDNQDLYSKNIFSVCREFVYENKDKPYRVDLALFLNGLPIVMIELKKQTAGQKAGFEGTKQFRETRNPEELVFSFNKRTLVYFAMDELVAFITTKLDKKETKFLPFNMGSEDEGAGNPVTEGKHSTYYVWEEILQRDMLLRIIREFMFIDDEGTMIFPRYHQLRAVLRCEKDVQTNGIGGRYLIWHSAGSGKTKTIAWLAKRLINFNDVNTVFVISDRTVIDGQLGTELINVDGKKGVAKHIEDGSKGLSKRIQDGGYIIVTTLQKFRPILNEIKQYDNRNYAIIIDEAHSSTAGKSMSKASETLTGVSLKDAVQMDEAYDELEDGQTQIIKNATTIKNTKNVSYFAFTATPKKETMELFGSRTENGKSYFDKYSMKQAEEEKYIINPLKCYTTYQDHYEIVKKKDDPTEYDSNRSQAAILNYVTSSEEVIDTKTEIMMNDFVNNRLSWLDGKAKAMIIAPSRKHAVLYKLAVDSYIKKHGCHFKSCVAFTGSIDINGIKHTEEGMNSAFNQSGVPYDIKAIIRNNDDLRIVIVADKLQTGFDENRLCVMYIDKKLGSEVKAVQTLSRLNRPAKKKRTFVLDFINTAETIKEYFEKYYGGELYLPTKNETDPNVLFSKRDHILDYCVVTLLDAEKLYDLIESEEQNSGEMTSIIANIQRNFKALDEERQKLFTSELKKFGKLFYYISAVYNNWNKDMEKLAVVFGVLYNVLYEKEVTEVVNPQELVELIDYSTKITHDELTIELDTVDQEFEGISTDVAATEKSYSVIDEIIDTFNSHYANAGVEIREIIDELSKDGDLQANVSNSSPSAYETAVSDRFSKKIDESIVDGLSTGEFDKAQFYSELSKDESAKFQICNRIIRNIKDLLKVVSQ